MFERVFLTVYYGFKSLLLHKLRAGLAMLGILIGVTAVIWLVALGEESVTRLNSRSRIWVRRISF